MVPIFCNNCFTPFSRGKLFSLTQCGHVFCSSCLSHGSRSSGCSRCKKRVNKMAIDKNMSETTKLLFKDLPQTFQSFQKIIKFQCSQRDILFEHYRKENQRLERLVACLKKRINFLMKYSSIDVSSEMYRTIKQEPADDYEINTYSELQPKNGKKLETSEFQENLEGVDWEETIETSNSETTEALPINDNPQVLLSNLNKRIHHEGQINNQAKKKIRFNMNIKKEPKELSLNQIQSQSYLELNHQNGSTSNNQASNRMNRVNTAPDMSHQSTLDQYFARARLNSNNFALGMSSAANIVPGSYPQTILSSRQIDAKTFSQSYNLL